MKTSKCFLFFTLLLTAFSSVQALQCKSFLKIESPLKFASTKSFLNHYSDIQVAVETFNLDSLPFNHETSSLVFKEPLKQFKKMTSQDLLDSLNTLFSETVHNKGTYTSKEKRLDNFLNFIFSAELFSRVGINTEMTILSENTDQPFELKITGTKNKDTVLDQKTSELKKLYGVSIVLSSKLIHRQHIAGLATKDKIELSLKEAINSRHYISTELSDILHHEIMHIEHFNSPAYRYTTELIVVPNQEYHEALGEVYKKSFFVDEVETWTADALRKYHVMDRTMTLEPSVEGALSIYQATRNAFEETKKIIVNTDFNQIKFTRTPLHFMISGVHDSKIALELNERLQEKTDAELKYIYFSHLTELEALLKLREKNMLDFVRIKSELRREAQESAAIMSGGI